MGDVLATWALVVGGQVTLSLVGLAWATQTPFRRGRAIDFPGQAEWRWLLPSLVLYWAVIGVHVLSLQLEGWATAFVGKDYAQAMYALEGDAVSVFQRLESPAADVFFLVAYVFGYPFMIYFAPFYYALHRDRKALRLAALSFAVLYAMTLPFYLFLPISNPWAVAAEPWYQGQAVAFKLGELWPDIIPSYWNFTSPNNELPSLHAAISAMTALVAWVSGYRRWAMLAGAFAVTIPVASFYMGVHWILDAVVGELFAVASVAAGLWLANRAGTGWTCRRGARAPATVDLAETPE